MNKKYFDIKKIHYMMLQKKYSEAIELLISLGFDNIKDENSEEKFWKIYFIRRCPKA